MAGLSSEVMDQLVKAFSFFWEYDYMLIDTSAGISRDVISFCMASSEVLLVVTPEPTSLTDGYALLKILSLNGFENDLRVIVNQSTDIALANKVFNRFKKVVRKFLPINVLPGGTILKDPFLVRSVGEQKPFFLAYPQADASKCIKNIGRYLVGEEKAGELEDEIETFWSNYLEKYNGPLQLSGVKVKEPQKNRSPDSQGSSQASPGVPGEITAEVRKSQDSDAKYRKGEDTRHMMMKMLDYISEISKELSTIRRVLESVKEG
jgi:flagellar biosynthesis protein FlhG